MQTVHKKQKVLFVCTGNSCRSQMAEGMLRHYWKDKFEVFSAGLDPSHVHPLAIKAMTEARIDISNQYSKTVNDFLGTDFSYVITVCDSAKERCPVFPGKYNAIHWSIEDPASAVGSESERMKDFRRVRQNIMKRINHFISNTHEQ
jgi:arsenate reductase